MVAILLNLVFQLLIVVLLIRYLIEKYRFYGFGPILVGIITASEKIIQPLKMAIPRSAFTLQDSVPLMAIGVVLMLRGYMVWLFADAFENPMLVMHQELNSGGLTLIHCMAVSLSMAAELIVVLITLCLFASLMISKRGITTCASAGFTCFQERTFTVFQWAKRLYRTDNLVVLFAIGSVVCLVGGSFAASLLNGAFLYGNPVFWGMVMLSLIGMLHMLIALYGAILLLVIVASWMRFDQFSLMVQLIRCMTDPYLNFFRRMFPWARIEYVDLSPILGFLLLNPVLTYGLYSLETTIRETILPVAGA